MKTSNPTRRTTLAALALSAALGAVLGTAQAQDAYPAKPVVIMASSGLLLGVNPGTGIKRFGDLLSQGRAKSLNFSSAGNGSPGHLAAAMLGNSTPVRTTHIPYRGNTPAVPTVAELGLKSLEQEVLYLVMVPADTPDAVVQTLAKGITEALQRPDAKERLVKLDLFYEGLTGTAAAQRLAGLSARYGQVVRATGITSN
jgi:tripartite-type tricarboxylate transporter receptor subunit TctC